MVGEILPSESVDEILQCDHSNKELSGSAVCFSVCFKMKFGFCLEMLALAISWSERIKCISQG